MRYSSIVICAAAFTSACASSPEEMPSVGRSSQASIAGTISGFVHSASASKFNVGDRAATTVDGPVVRKTGSFGSFATFSWNNAVLALPHASDGRDIPFGDFTADQHNVRVQAYFVGAGLPADQVAGVHVTTLMKSGGPTVTTGTPLSIPSTFIAYFSIVERAVDGIPVDESFAWARLDQYDNSVSEGVYWPSLPGAVVSDAKALAAMLADPLAAASFRAKLPSGLDSGGKILIHHTHFMNRGAFTAQATYDVSQSRATGKPTRRHFLLDGTEVRLPEEGGGSSITASGPKP